MELSAVVLHHLADKLLHKSSGLFHEKVIQRWSAWRAREFITSFLEAVNTRDTENIEVFLDIILEDESYSETLFDSYRRVCLSRSKNLGPRIIGILTAQLLNEKRTALESEDSIFMAAESLTDGELLQFLDFFNKTHEQAQNEKFKKDTFLTKDGALKTMLADEQIDSNWNTKTDVSIGPINLNIYFDAKWPEKLKQASILSDDIQEKQWQYEEDSDGGIDAPGTMRTITWWLTIEKQYFKLADLIRLAEKKSGTKS